MMLTLVLDAIENHHIMTMVHSIQNRIAAFGDRRRLQMIASQVKFHASYLAVLLFSFGFLQFGRLGRDHRGRAVVLYSMRRTDLGDAG